MAETLPGNLRRRIVASNHKNVALQSVAVRTASAIFETVLWNSAWCTQLKNSRWHDWPLASGAPSYKPAIRTFTLKKMNNT